MTDRLGQIWQSFAERTGARLTSRDIAPSYRPQTETRGDPKAALSEGFADKSDAVHAALTALHADVQAKARKAQRSKRPAGTAHYSADAEHHGEPGLPHSLVDDRLLADLRSTEARTRRSGLDYLSFAEERQRSWKKRRKFLGIF